MNEATQISWEERLPALPDATEEWATEVEQRCEEGGWSCVRRQSGRLTVALETTPVLHATVSQAGEGVRLYVELADFSAMPAVCRKAAETLVFEAAARFPTVRPTMHDTDARLGYETSFAQMPTPEELSAAAGALSAAVALTADAIDALQNENLARDYLAIRGYSAEIEKQNEERKNT